MKQILEFLKDFVLLFWHILKNIFTKYLIINLWLLIIYLALRFKLNNIIYISLLKGTLFTIFTAVNLTNSCTNYCKEKEDNKICLEFMQDALKLFNRIAIELNYLNQVTLWGKLVDKTNTNSQDVLLYKSSFILKMLNNIKNNIKKTSSTEKEIFVMYCGFIRFMEENHLDLEHLNNTLIKYLLQYTNDTNIKIYLIHLQEVCISLLKKYTIILNSGEAHRLEQMYFRYKKAHDSINYTEEDIGKSFPIYNDISLEDVQNLNIHMLEERAWGFNNKDLKKDLFFLIDIICKLYPIFIQKSHISKNDLE